MDINPENRRSLFVDILLGAIAAGVIVDGFARNVLPDAKEVFYVDIPPDFQKRRGKTDLTQLLSKRTTIRVAGRSPAKGFGFLICDGVESKLL